MQTVRKQQDARAGAREALKKRRRACRSTANFLTQSHFVVGSGFHLPRRRPRPPQPVDDTGNVKYEKSRVYPIAASAESSTASPSGVVPESNSINSTGSPKRREAAAQDEVNGTTDGAQQLLQNSRSPLRSGEEVEPTSLKSRDVRKEGVVASGRIYPHAIPMEATTSRKAPPPLPNVGYITGTQRVQVATVDNGTIKSAHQSFTDRSFVQATPAPSASVIGKPKNTVSVEVDLSNTCSMALDGHNQASSARFDETGQMPQKSIASTNVIQLLLGKQLPSCAASAVSLLEGRLRGKLAGFNGACSPGKLALQRDQVAHEKSISEGEEGENKQNSSDENNKSSASEGADSSGVTRCSSSSLALQTHAHPPLYYTVLTGNGMHTKQDTAGNIGCPEEQADHENYPVVKGVSRDNTKKRWAVYWKGSRKYFYDKCYADCHQAYLSAVEFRRQAKACNAPGPPPKKSTLQSEFYLPAAAPSFRFTSYSPAIPSFSLTPSTPLPVPHCETASPCAALLAKCGPSAMGLSTELPDHQVLGSTRRSDFSVSLNKREALSSRSEPDTCLSSPTTADSCDNITTTLQVYRCAVIILLQDLLYEVLPPRVVALGPAQRTPFPEPPLRARAEERFLSASLLLLQRTLQGHIAKAERGGEEDLNQLLSILMPSLDRQLLPSELPRELQQNMLLKLTTLRL